jgi:hypothetical protein
MDPSEVRERRAEVLAKIAAAAARAGRSPDSVCLVAVSKTHPAAAIARLAEAGCSDFGENYVQELLAKQAQRDVEPRLADVRWHFIGHLQRNKVAQLLSARPVLIHSVDSERLLREIDKRAAAPTAVLLEVNVAGEASKSGCAPAQVAELVAVADRLEKATLRGLMIIPPAEGPEAARPYFRALRELRDRIGAERLPELSMGMSADYEVAIEEGATLVRVGTALFGAREQTG